MFFRELLPIAADGSDSNPENPAQILKNQKFGKSHPNHIGGVGKDRKFHGESEFAIEKAPDAQGRSEMRKYKAS